MKRNITTNKTSILLGLACLASSAQAHIGYGGRNFGTFSGLEAASASINNQTSPSNYGWADAADGILGDSHRGRAFRFTLQNEASITLTVSANASVGTMGAGLIPAFSIYGGLAAISPFTAPQTSADHDSATASVAWQEFYEQANGQTLGISDGNWNALGDWKIAGDGETVVGNDFSQLSSFSYKGSAAAVGGASTISGTFTLAAGDYTIFIGGNDITKKAAESAVAPAYGIAATLNVSGVTPVPEPQTYALIAAGAAMVGLGLRRRK